MEIQHGVYAVVELERVRGQQWKGMMLEWRLPFVHDVARICCRLRGADHPATTGAARDGSLVGILGVPLNHIEAVAAVKGSRSAMSRMDSCGSDVLTGHARGRRP
jgi:hypothetical protein